jgi:hypothetical protein
MEARSRLSDAQIEEIKARADLAGLVDRFGGRLRKSGRKLIGSCPLCGGGKTATRFEIKADGESWVCAVCHQGGDAIKLVELATGRDFRDAVEFLGGPAQLDDEEAHKLAARRRAESEQREKNAEAHRQKEIGRAARLWNDCEFFGVDGVRAYLRGRGIPQIPNSADLRLARAAPYFHGERTGETGRREPVVLFRGPAMVAAIRDNAGAISGAHLTYLRDDFSAKRKIGDPETGADLPSKKVRGSKAGGHIVLRQTPQIERLFLGEGIETVLSVATALRACGRLLPGDGFWSSVDLGNLGGPALESVVHPEARTPGGRRLRVPGDQPDLEQAGIVIPAGVSELVLLGDGDSDAFTTRMALLRGAARYARTGLKIRIAMAPTGMDFNDLLQVGARSEATSAGRRAELVRGATDRADAREDSKKVEAA